MHWEHTRSALATEIAEAVVYLSKKVLIGLPVHRELGAGTYKTAHELYVDNMPLATGTSYVKGLTASLSHEHSQFRQVTKNFDS